MSILWVVLLVVVIALMVAMAKAMVTNQPHGGAWIGPFADPFNFPAIGSRDAERRQYIEQCVHRIFPD